MSSNLKVNTILPSTGSNVAIGTAGGTVTIVGNVDNDIHISDKIVHDGDTNTSIRFPSSDTITFEAGGSEKFRITSPASTFQNKLIIDDGSNGHLFLNNTASENTIHSGTTGFSAYKNLVINAAQHIFKVSNVPKVRIDTNGRLLIGTNSSAYKLCVADDTNASLVSQVVNTNTGSSTKSIFQIQTGSNRYVNFENDYTGQYVHIVGVGINTYFSSFDTHRFRNNAGTERVLINSSGNVGINQTSPTAKLEIVDSAYHQLYVKGSSTVAGIRFGNSGNQNGFIYYDNGPNLIFNINNSEKVRITSAGKVGIGTNNPTQIFNIYGTNLKPVIGDRTAHTPLYSVYDSQNNTTLEISSSGTGTNVAGLTINNPTTSANSSYKTISFSCSATSSVEKRGAIIGSNHDEDSSSTIKGNFYVSTNNGSGLQQNLQINHDGHVTKPNQPSFLVAPANDGQTANGYVTYTTVFHNTGTHYSTSTGKFTAPVTGYYNFGANYVGGAACENVFVRFYINGGVNQRGQHYSGGGNGWGTGSPYMSVDLSGTHTLLQAGDYVQLNISATGATQGQSGYMRFYGYLVH